MTNVIREDVVRVDFECNDALKEIRKLKDDIDELKKKFTGDFDNGVFDELKKDAEKPKKPLEKIKEQADKVRKSLTDIGKKGATAAWNGLKKIARISFKALAVGVAAVATAVGKIAYEAVQAYADFEQLKGGVETLFKDNADTIMKYANNAYKTAGLSANAYMETVTSFSASLIQSCGGDTAKAAKLADIAISDMSDNANKMGTDMGSLQYAYQGFAKQNYTMLDNLKLGYGGTKSEMERLVKDAAKLDKSIDGNSLSYANIVKAIHAVQKNMDIYGTTQKEAEKTITGSLNAMKSSWQNLLTAMASGENLDQCVDNMVSSVEIFAGNVMPVAEKALIGLSKVIEKLAPIIADKLPNLADKLLPPLISATIVLVKGLIKALPNIVKTLFEALGDIVGEQFPALKGFFDLFAKNADKIVNFIPVIIGLVGAFKLLSSVSPILSLFGGKESKGGKGGKGKKGGLFSGIMDLLKGLAKEKPSTILKGLGNLAIIIAGFAAITALLIWVAPYIAQLGDLGSILKMVVIMGALGLVAYGISKLAIELSKIKITDTLKGMANMGIALGSFAIAYMILGAISLIPFDIGRIMQVVGVIGVIGVVAAAFAAVAGLLGLIPILVVLLGMANLGIALYSFAIAYMILGAIALIPFDLNRTMKVVDAIGVIGAVAASLAVFAGVAGLLGPYVAIGLASIATALTGFGLIILAFYGLSQIPHFDEFLEKGGTTLKKLVKIIGEIAGALIGGIGEGITNSLPTIGKNLADFAKSIKPMFTLFSGVDMSGVGEFFTAIGKFMLLMAGEKLLSFLTGKPDFEGIAKGLETLAGEGVKKFFTMVNGLGDGAFEKGAKFFETLDGISSLPNSGGLAQLFSGETDFVGTASGLGRLAGEGVKNFFKMVEGMKEIAFNNAKLFFESLDGISSLPNVGGLGQLFSGKNDFAGVASGLEKLSSEGVKNFFAMVAGLDSGVFTKTKELFAALADIGNVGEEGFWERIGKAITGDKDKSGISKIADELSTFGEKTKVFFASVNSLNLNNLNGLWKSLENAGKLTTENLGSVVDDCISSIVDKISNLPKQMGDALKNNSNDFSNGFVEMWEAAVKASMSPVNKLLDGANHILKQFGSEKKLIEWTPYARGTGGHKGGNAVVNDGRGAELVQMPNGHTFIPHGRNVFLPNAPKGMKVLSAERTARLMGKRSPTFNYANGIGDIDIWSFFDNAKGLVDKIASSIGYGGLSGFQLDVSKAVSSTFSGSMVGWVKKLFEEGGQTIASYVASKGVNQWLPTVVRALKMEGQYSAANVARTLFQMKTESGGNPKAINLWDSNAKKGIPSKGLMQVIDPTFNAYAREGFNKNIYDPLSNILASIRYAVSRYGSLSNAYKGTGYANGVGTFSMPSESPINLSYTPDSSYTGGNVEITEYNTYSPQLYFTISGSSDDRALARKIKKVVQEAIADVIDGAERSNPRLKEV